MSSNVTIGNLTALSTVSDSTVFASEDSGFTRKVTAAVLKNYMATTTSIVASGPINAGGGLTANSIQAGTIGNIGAVIIGTISTNYQPGITGVGTLANLTVSGATAITGATSIVGTLNVSSNVNLSGNLVSTNAASFSAINNTVIGNVSHATGRFTTLTATAVNAGTIGNTGATLTGTLSTAAQPNITSVGTLTSLAVSGNISGTLTTAAQPNITSVGTLGSLTVSGNAAVGNISGTKGTFTQLAGTVLTSAQPNITSVGTLGTLAVTGATTSGNLITTNGVFWANGSVFTTTVATNFNNIASNVTPAANLTYNLGSPTAWWSTMYGVSVQAQYADLAENYSAAQGYAPGTVVVWSTGLSEIETSDESHTPRVAGIISTDPAYLMNAATAGLPVALAGRVPCKVRGPVSKSDRLVNIEAGVAGRLDMSKFTPGCVLGYALESVPDGELATIEVVITRF